MGAYTTTQQRSLTEVRAKTDWKCCRSSSLAAYSVVSYISVTSTSVICVKGQWAENVNSNSSKNWKVCNCLFADESLFVLKCMSTTSTVIVGQSA